MIESWHINQVHEHRTWTPAHNNIILLTTSSEIIIFFVSSPPILTMYFRYTWSAHASSALFKPYFYHLMSIPWWMLKRQIIIIPIESMSAPSHTRLCDSVKYDFIHLLQNSAKLIMCLQLYFILVFLHTMIFLQISRNVALLRQPKFVKKIFFDLKIYIESCYLNAETLLITNDRRFYSSMSKSSFFFSKVVCSVVKDKLKLIPATIVLAQDVVNGMP